MLSSIIQSLYLRCKQNVESSFRTRNLTNAITNDFEQKMMNISVKVSGKVEKQT